MAGNNQPIFSREGDIQGGVTIQLQSTTDYTGVGVNNAIVFTADATAGGFIQRLRFKAAGTNIATVARVYINEGRLNQTPTISTPGPIYPTTSTTGGTLLQSTYFARVQAVDQWGGATAFSAETATSIQSTFAGSITWTWTTSTGAASYRLFVGPQSGGEYAYFTTNTNVYTQTVPYISTQIASTGDYVVNNMFIGEVSLPATTAAANAATVEVDYPLNVALPPGQRVIVGLGTTVAAGWVVTSIGGKY